MWSGASDRMSGRMSTADANSNSDLNSFNDMARATRKLEKRRSNKKPTDEYYASFLVLRTVAASSFLSNKPPKWLLPITSIMEDKLLKALGCKSAVRSQIEGLQNKRTFSKDATRLTEDQHSTLAIVRLAADPPPEVGLMQRKTRNWLLRPFPLGVRFSGKNMSPLPPWLGGAQHVCLNFSDVDLAVQLHFALFKGSEGYVLKPDLMRAAVAEDSAVKTSDRDADEHYWPAACSMLFCATIEILSLHQCPKRGERRPRFDGSRGACHRFHPELSGTAAPPNHRAAISPVIKMSIHPIGGFCAISDILPLPLHVEIEMSTSTVQCNGMNAVVCEKMHCVAAEPHACFLRFGIVDHGDEVAYTTAVLGRLRRGFRVLLFRGPLGTRIELAHAFVHITHGQVPNVWVTPRQLRVQSNQRNFEMSKMQKELAELRSLPRSESRSALFDRESRDRTPNPRG